MQRQCANASDLPDCSGPTWVELGAQIRGLAAELMDSVLATGTDPRDLELWLGAPAARDGRGQNARATDASLRQ